MATRKEMVQLETRLRMANPALMIECRPRVGYFVGRPTPDGGIAHISRPVDFPKLEMWVEGYLACRNKTDEAGEVW